MLGLLTTRPVRVQRATGSSRMWVSLSAQRRLTHSSGEDHAFAHWAFLRTRQFLGYRCLVSQSVSLRERKKLDTRHALSEAALALAVEHGYGGFTIADVTEAVGVSRRTFSNYFASKAECLIALFDRRLDEILRELDDAPAQVSLAELMVSGVMRGAEEIAVGSDAFRSLVRDEPELQAVMALHDAALVTRVTEAVERRTGLRHSDIRARLAAELWIRAATVCIEAWIAEGRRGGTAALAADFALASSLIDLSGLPSAPAERRRGPTS
jgi:AcrR family transcriptional regulator